MKVFVIAFGLGMVEGVIVADWLRSRFEVRKGRRAPLNASQRNMKRGTKADKAVANLK